MNSEKTKVGSISKLKFRNLQQPTLSWKSIFKATALVLDDKVFNYSKTYAAKFLENNQDIDKFFAVNYKM